MFALIWQGVFVCRAQPLIVLTHFALSHTRTNIHSTNSLWMESGSTAPTNTDRFCLTLLSDTPQYKFIVDGEWKYDPNQPAMFDEMGNVNNVLEVHEYVPENLDGLSGFDPPPSPPSRWVCAPLLCLFACVLASLFIKSSLKQRSGIRV